MFKLDEVNFTVGYTFLSSPEETEKVDNLFNICPYE